jgi:hypothetical protein
MSGMSYFIAVLPVCVFHQFLERGGPDAWNQGWLGVSCVSVVYF